MSSEIETFDFGYSLMEIRETKDAIKAKMFTQKDLEVFTIDGIQGDLAKILMPLNIALVQLAWR